MLGAAVGLHDTLNRQSSVTELNLMRHSAACSRFTVCRFLLGKIVGCAILVWGDGRESLAEHGIAKGRDLPGTSQGTWKFGDLNGSNR